MWNKLGKKLDKSIGILRGFKTAKLLSIFSTILLSNLVSLPTWAQSGMASLEEKTIVQEVIYNKVEPIADLLTQELGFDYGGTQIGSLASLAEAPNCTTIVVSVGTGLLNAWETTGDSPS
jgi:hypothetical protein